MIYIHHCDSPLGGITLTSDGEALTGLRFDGQIVPDNAPAEAYEKKDLPVFAETAGWLDLYFSGKDPGFTPELSIRATAFRKAVLETVMTIPYGKTMTYGEIADRAAKQMNLPRMSARAAGGAVGRNPIALIIPCHRVIGKDGTLTGYAGGIERKRRLLELENVPIMDRNRGCII